jgi:glycosyltransferase involved in cell wall biosynthesis
MNSNNGKVLYSICITHYNNFRTVRGSLDGLLNQIDDRFEVVVTDNKSTDGSLKILQEYASKGRIKLIVKKCSRGTGRQTSLENSIGEYVISGLDLDDIFRPRLIALLRFYHEKCEGMLLHGQGEATMVAPRKLLFDLGGWRSLQFRENWELSRRAAGIGKYRWTIFPIVEEVNKHVERKNRINVLKYRLIRYRENLRLGHPIYEEGEKRGLGQVLTYALAILACLFYPSYKDGLADFTSVSHNDFVDSRDWWPENRVTERERMIYRARFGIEI